MTINIDAKTWQRNPSQVSGGRFYSDVDKVPVTTVAHGDVVTITGSGFGTRTNVKPVYVSFGNTKTPSDLGRVTTGYFTAITAATTAKTTGELGGSVVGDVGVGSLFEFLPMPNPDGPFITYLERYYDFDVTDPDNWEPGPTNGVNLKTNRCWALGNSNNWYIGSNYALSNNGLWNVENVGNNVNKYYDNYPPAFQWLAEEILFKHSSAGGVRDGRLLHYRNGTLLNTLAVDQDATTYDAGEDSFKPYRMVLDQMSNNNLPGPFNIYYAYLLYDDEYNAVYIGNAPTRAACTGKMVRVPQTAWSNGSASFVALDTGIPLASAYAYVKTGEETWASENGIPSSEWSVE